MTASLNRWWTGLSPRERWLVGIAGALAALVGGWFLVLLPLQSALSSARESHGLALERHGAIAARADAIQAAQALPRARTRPGGDAALDLYVGQSAAEAGFTLSRNDARGADEAAVAIASARAPALLGWIDGLEQAGVIVADLALRPNANGSVSLTATLRRQP